MAMSQTPLNALHYLVAVAGPAIPPMALADRDLTLGRHESCQLLMPADADKVSRFHAKFSFRDRRWHIADAGSRWGTYLNGRKLEPGEFLPLAEGDLVRIAPWTLTLSRTAARRGLQLGEDADQMSSIVRSHAAEPGAAPARPLAEEMLALLLETAAGFYASTDETSLAQLLITAATRGTGLRNATVLRPVDTAGKYEIVATNINADGETSRAGNMYSRSLIAAASDGSVAEFSAQNAGGDIAESIMRLRITSAICAPLMLGNTVAAYLYLDARGNSMAAGLRANAVPFCAALARMASLALANLKRLDMEKRQASVEAELSAGAEAQRWVLPKRTNTLGVVSYIGESRPGRYVGGDFFDVLELPDGKVALALGDVAGKGIAASVLMTAAQGYLHSALLTHADLGAAVTALNRFICPRCPTGKFLTLFVAVIDPHTQTMHYIDAGHGYAFAAPSDGNFAQITGESDLPIGVADEIAYTAQSRPFAVGDRLLIVSDGCIEQPAANAGPREQFDGDGVIDALAQPAVDPVQALFDALFAFAGSTHLADDATAVLATLRQS